MKLPIRQKGGTGEGVETGVEIDEVNIANPDQIKTMNESAIGMEGMKIDRKLFEKAKEEIENDVEIKDAVDNEQWDRAIAKLREKYEDKPNLFINLEKIRKSENLDRRLSWREFLERVFGFIDTFKTKNDKLDEECEKFIAIYKPESKYVPYIRNYLKAYVTDPKFREIINNKHFADLNFYPAFSINEYKSLNGYQNAVPEYVKDYVSLNAYMN